MKAAIEETDRTDRTQGVPFLPSEEWIDEFEKQSTENGFEERLKRFARMRANMVAHAGRRVDDLYARELVQDAIEDTLEGVLAWDPERATLEQHLMGAIRSRTRHDYVQAQRFPHHSFDATSAPSALMADVESSLAGNDNATASADVVSAAERALAEIRRIAANDADVLRLIDAYADEATKKADVLRVSGMNSKRYEAARKRMQRLVLQLPTEVREAVRA
jgi:hypothetical protein